MDACPARVSEIVGEGEGEREGGSGGVERENRSGEEARKEELVCLSDDLLLKVSSLCILISNTSRKQGLCSLHAVSEYYTSYMYM